MSVIAPSHPAKFPTTVLAEIAERAEGRVLDPFAGTGRIHQLVALSDAVTHTVGVEIEPEWAAMHPATVVGNALALPFPAASFDCVATSPCWGNRLADHHNAQDGSPRHSYTHDLGRPLHPRSSGTLAFGEQYRVFHRRAWQECRRVLRPGGLMIVNVGDFIRNHQIIPVVSAHRLVLIRLGFTLLDEVLIDKVGLRHGANRERVSHEVVLVFSHGRHRQPVRRRTTARRPRSTELAGQLSIYDVIEETS